MIEQAAFSFKDFRFDKIKMDFSILRGTELRLEIKPYGFFHSSTGSFELHFIFTASNKSEENEEDVLDIHCVSNFEFKNVHSIEEVPEYFYANSLAIVFPYVRAFVSNVTLQSNIKPLVLPTMNLSGLQEELKRNLKVD